MTIKEMENLARELRNIQTLIAEAETEAEAIKDKIKSEMGETEMLMAGEYKILWKTVESSRLDTTALKKALPDVAATFTKKTTSRRFSIS